MINFHVPYDNFIFDVGNVLLTWNPSYILETVLPNNTNNPDYLLKIFKHSDWLEIDKGVLTEETAIPLFSQRTNLPQETIKKIFHTAKSTLKPIEESLSLLNKLAGMGKNLYCLSNMSTATFEYVRCYDFWSQFKGIVVSGHINLTKPDPKIFEYTMEKFSLLKEKTIFIDDMQRNTDAAETLGIKSIVFTDAYDCIDKLQRLIINSRN